MKMRATLKLLEQYCLRLAACYARLGADHPASAPLSRTLRAMADEACARATLIRFEMRLLKVDPGLFPALGPDLENLRRAASDLDRLLSQSPAGPGVGATERVLSALSAGAYLRNGRTEPPRGLFEDLLSNLAKTARSHRSRLLSFGTLAGLSPHPTPSLEVAS